MTRKKQNRSAGFGKWKRSSENGIVLLVRRSCKAGVQGLRETLSDEL